ncbi:MAG: hypothetical protein WBF33_01890, partial [Candidatus Nitrosopolaris sp.]
IPNAMQTSDILLPERSGSIIILYLFSIISTCYYTPRLECQPCMEAAQLINRTQLHKERYALLGIF